MAGLLALQQLPLAWVLTAGMGFLTVVIYFLKEYLAERQNDMRQPPQGPQAMPPQVLQAS
jgi:hypothetical protein